MEQNKVKLGMLVTMHSDLEKSIEFYELLGLKLHFHNKGVWAEFDLQGLRFGLCPTKEKLDNVRTGIVLEIEEDLIVLYNRLHKKGILFLNEPQIAPEGVMVGVKDPSGNVIDLYQPNRIKESDFISKSSLNREVKA